MNYEGLIIRPPSEADSLILQVTVGCSHNRCTFCPAYKQKQFRIKSEKDIRCDIEQAARMYGDEVRRVFLCDGDPLIMPQERLIEVLNLLHQTFPKLQRIGIYGNAKSILRKSIEELAALRQKKLGIIYMGLESGDPVVLDKVQKGVVPEQMIEAARRVREATIKLNVTVLLGLGGRERSRIHAQETMRVLNKMQPNHVAALTLMVVPGTPLYEQEQRGEFALPDKFELLAELRTMIAESALDNCLFFSNHASNYFPVQARLPRDKDKIIRALDAVIASRDERCLRSEFMRAL
ncbi:MAG: B12-binding domain-containing radical SAM protein [Desulfobacterota bacterium]|nr:B12-binding domain-containing radical SAM protein [Thermodesulfobacteriota bacterium]